MPGRQKCQIGCVCKRHSEETRAKLRAAHQRRLGTEVEVSRRRKIGLAFKGVVGHSMSEETRRKIGEANRRRICSDATKKKMSQTRLGRPKSAEVRQKLSDATTGKKQSVETRERLRQLSLELWQCPEYVKAQMEARGVKPNKLELQLGEKLALLGFRYVGDGQLVIGGKCPDFWDGGTRLVELYGDYWHRGQDPQERIDHFARYGYECQVVWERELVQGVSV